MQEMRVSDRFVRQLWISIVSSIEHLRNGAGSPRKRDKFSLGMINSGGNKKVDHDGQPASLLIAKATKMRLVCVLVRLDLEKNDRGEANVPSQVWFHALGELTWLKVGGAMVCVGKSPW